MPSHILKLPNGLYMEWSTIIDAPKTFAMPLEKFMAWYRNEYGRSGYEGLDRRLERVEKTGLSERSTSDLNSFIAENHAGPDGEEIDLEKIMELYAMPDTSTSWDAVSIADPDWAEDVKSRNWRNHVSDHVREIWSTFTDVQRMAIYRQADDAAKKESWE